MQGRSPIVVQLVDPDGAAEVAKRVAAPLEPLHPGSTDPELRTFFLASAGKANPKALLARLRRDPAVAAAYIKPADEPP